MMQNVAISTGKIVLYFILAGLLAAGTMEFALPALGMQFEATSPLTRTLLLGVVSFFAMSLPAMVLMAAFDGKSPMAMGLQPKGSIADFLAGGFVGGFIFVSALAAAVFGGFAQIDPDFSTVSMQAMAVTTLGVTLASAGEEVMMRGFVLQELMSKFSTTASVVVSSLLFAALHAGALLESNMALIGAANVFLASVLLSLAYLATRSLWLPIGVHAGWNVMQGPVLGINVSGNDLGSGWQPVTFTGPDMMTGGTLGFEGSVLALIGPTMGILMMLLFGRRKA